MLVCSYKLLEQEISAVGLVSRDASNWNHIKETDYVLHGWRETSSCNRMTLGPLDESQWLAGSGTLGSEQT